MSITPLEGDMEIATNPTLAKILKKINELVGASNDDFDRIYAMNNKIVTLEKELKDLKTRVANIG